MSEIDQLVKQAIEAFRADRKSEARDLFMQVVKKDQQHEVGWLYLGAVVDTLEDQQVCLENVLTINPDNKKARKGLDTVLKKLAAQTKATPDEVVPPSVDSFEALPAAEPSPNDTSSSPFVTGADTPVSPPTDDPFSWLSPAGEQPVAAEPASNPFASAPSFDWGQSAQPATTDDDKQGSQDWDAWIQEAGAGSNEAAPFGDSPAEVSSAPFADVSGFGFQDSGDVFFDDVVSNEQSDQINDSFSEGSVSAWESPFFEEEVVADEPLATAAFSMFDEQKSDFGVSESSVESSTEVDKVQAVGGTDDVSFAESAFESPFFFDEAPATVEDTVEEETPKEDFVFNFDEGDEDDVFGSQLATATEVYYREIPDEIEALSGGIAPRSLALLGGIGLLVVLNLVSFAALIL